MHADISISITDIIIEYSFCCVTVMYSFILKHCSVRSVSYDAVLPTVLSALRSQANYATTSRYQFSPRTGLTADTSIHPRRSRVSGGCVSRVEFSAGIRQGYPVAPCVPPETEADPVQRPFCQLNLAFDGLLVLFRL